MVHRPARRIDIELVHPGLRHARRRPLRRAAHHQVGRHLHRHRPQHRVGPGVRIDVQPVKGQHTQLVATESLGKRGIKRRLTTRQIQFLRRGPDDQRHLGLQPLGEHLFRCFRQDAAVDHRLQPDEAGIRDRHRQLVGGRLKIGGIGGTQIGQGRGGARGMGRIGLGQVDAHGFVLLQAARRQAELRRPAFLDGAGEQPPRLR